MPGDKWYKGFEPSFLEGAAIVARDGSKTNNTTALLDCFKLKCRFADYGIYQRAANNLIHQVALDPKVVAVGDKNNTIGISPIQFLYMDVGCWAGNGSPGWDKHREFGLVYGPLVVLCSYGNVPKPYAADLSVAKFLGLSKGTEFIDISILVHPSFSPLKGLLENLENILDPQGKTRSLKILSAAVVSSWLMPVPRALDTDPIMVFLGDFHAPVATSSADAHIVEAGKEMLKGRLDALPPQSYPIPVYPGIGGPPNPFEWWLQQTLSPMNYGASTSARSVDAWLDFYHRNGDKRAEIFEDAGQDLRTLTDYLANFHKECWPLRVFQLGDLFDLWMGFQRGFGANADDLYPDTPAFARFWVERTLFSAGQGSHLTHLLTLPHWAEQNKRTKAPLRTHFLYGNHDNYRRHAAGGDFTVPNGREHAGHKINVFPAPSAFSMPGLLAEHGHQPDTSNSDDNPGSGHAMTQAAYFATWVRGLEGFGSWARSILLSGDLNTIPRIVCMKHALEHCLNIPGNYRGIYVMGHSHEPMLKRVELWPSPPRPPA